MNKIIPCYNSEQQTLADQKDEERMNREGFRYLINDLHQLSFKTALKAAEQSIREGSDPKRAILNNFELYLRIQLLRRELSEPGTDLGLEPEWEETEYTKLTYKDFVMALSPEAVNILLEDFI
jgi:hypothetical protein